MTTIQLHRQLPAMPPQERLALERRARLLAWGGNAWHVVEFAIAVGAGIAAGSIALIGFGVDSLIEALAEHLRWASLGFDRSAPQLLHEVLSVLKTA